MKRMFNVYERVVPILKNYPGTRNSDGDLIATVDESINPAITNMSYGYVMRNRRYLGLPSCESIRRSRQKAFTEHPELKANEQVQKYRNNLEKEYIDFARSKQDE